MTLLEALPYLIALLPALIFYLAYSQYFVFAPDFKNHLAAFAGGSLAAGLLALLRFYLPEIAEGMPAGFQAFVLAALPEKLAIFLVILLFLRVRPIIPVESVVSAALAGLGFSVVENILYTAHFGGMMLARSLAVTPLHFASSGIMGYFIALIRLKKDSRIWGGIKALGLAIGLHGTYDYFILSRQEMTFWALAPLLAAIILLDYFMAKCRTIPPSDILDALGIHFPGWLITQRQFQYERWILKEKADFEPGYEPLFQWKLHRFRVVLGLFLLLPPAWYLLHRGESLSFLNKDAMLSVFVFLPLSLILILLVVGIFNPAYFKHGLIRIPAMMQLRFLEHPEWPVSTAYDVRSYGCFVKTPSPLHGSDWLTIELGLGKYTSGPLACRVVQENHKNIRQPLGSLLSIQEYSWSFRIFLLRNMLFRWKSGLVLLLKLPGHNLLKRLFITPESVAKDLRFFPKGTQILHEGRRGQEFFLIRQGEVEIFKDAHAAQNKSSDEKASLSGKPTVLARLGPGQIVGEMALAGNVPRNASAVCVSDCILSLADGSDLDSLVRQNPDFARQLLATIARRAFASGEALDDKLRGLEGELDEMGTAFRSVLLLALLGGKDSRLDRNALVASLHRELYEELRIPKSELRSILADVSQGRAPKIPKDLQGRLQSIKLRVRWKKQTQTP